MEYRGFYILKKKPGLYWIICEGSMLGSAVSEDLAKDYIDELSTLYV